ncbi:MgtC/SapB family protein [Moraxella osloensis]|uniref:MgtC/SapB family protein n=1 Tax=Faucicola osloensis TaxID=34062 RepID=UPI0034DE4887
MFILFFLSDKISTLFDSLVGDMIEGTSTAAAIWSAGCVGVAVAMGRLEIAVLISVFMVGIFYFVSPLKQKLSKDNDDV